MSRVAKTILFFHRKSSQKSPKDCRQDQVADKQSFLIYPTLWRPSATFCFHFPSRPYRLVAAIIDRKRKFRFHVIKLAEPKTKILKVSNEIEKRKLWLTHRAEFPLFQAMFPQSHTAAKRGAKQSDWVNVLRIYCPHKSTVVGRHWVYRFFWDFCLDFSFYFVSP